MLLVISKYSLCVLVVPLHSMIISHLFLTLIYELNLRSTFEPIMNKFKPQVFFFSFITYGKTFTFCYSDISRINFSLVSALWLISLLFALAKSSFLLLLVDYSSFNLIYHRPFALFSSYLKYYSLLFSLRFIF